MKIKIKTEILLPVEIEVDEIDNNVIELGYDFKEIDGIIKNILIQNNIEAKRLNKIGCWECKNFPTRFYPE